MSYGKRHPTAARRSGTVVLTLLVLAVTALAGLVGLRPAALFSAASPVDEIVGGRGESGARSTADGHLPDGVTVFEDEYPAVANLDPALAEALRRATADAADEGVGLHVTSGWRSVDYQERLLHDAISEYGSAHEAARWVSTPDTSSHVSGDAVDIAGTEARAWLSAYGARYGLCQVYDNEPWHYELRPDAVAQGCPARYPDPTYDPRMLQTRPPPGLPGRRPS